VNKDSFRQAVATLEMPLRRYLLVVLAPGILGAILVAVLLPVPFPTLFTGALALVPAGLGALVAGTLVAFPFIKARQRGHEIDHAMHYFITHLGMLSTSRIPPVDFFEMIGDKQTEYGALDYRLCLGLALAALRRGKRGADTKEGPDRRSRLSQASAQTGRDPCDLPAGIVAANRLRREDERRRRSHEIARSKATTLATGGRVDLA